MSGNPAGRTKGSKNAITLLKQSLELQLRKQAAPDLGSVLAKAVEMALDGDKDMIKLLLTLHISKPVASEDESTGKNQVNILVQNLTKQTEVSVKEVIDVEAISAGSDRHSEEHAEVDSVSAEAGLD